MAYNVSNKFREVLYSGESQYDCKLYFNGDRVPAEQIQNIKISSPIIDTTEETGTMFHIGTFISQAITIKFRNLDGLDLKSNPTVYLEIGLNVNGNMEYVPIGYYMIDDLEENYQSSCEITCLDYAVKFKPNIDITQFFDGKGEIEAGALFEAICIYYGVQPGTYPNVNNNKKIRLYDSNLSGKEYVSMLAELFGGNAKMGRDGKCYIVPLKNNQYITIDALSSKNIEIGDTYEITRVCYDDGRLKLQSGGDVITVDILPNVTQEMDKTAYYYLTTEQKYYKYNSSTNEWQVATDIKNTLYLRQDNLYITEQETVTNIYNAVRGFIVQNITCENRADLSLDAWDTIQYTTDKGVYYTLNNNEVTFNGTSMGKVYTNIPTGKKAETTNILKGTVNQTIRRIQTEINEIEGSVTTVIQEVDGQNQKISEVSQTVNELNSKIGDIADITTSKESTNGTVSFEKINQSEPIYIRIYPTGVNISYLYPNNGLFPNETLYATTRTLRFTNTKTSEIFDYKLPSDLLYYNQDNYDEFILDYDSQSCEINKKVGYNSDGTTYPLDKIQTTSYPFPKIELTEGDYIVEVLDYRNAYLFVRLIAQNIYTTQFATKAELNSEIKQTREEINLNVDKKLTSYPTTTQMNSAINLKADSITSTVSSTYATKQENNNTLNTAQAYTNTRITQTKSEIKQTTDSISLEVGKKVNNEDFNGANIMLEINADTSSAIINADKISLSGKIFNLTTEDMSIISDNFSVDKYGNITATSGTLGGWTLSNEGLIDTSRKIYIRNNGYSSIYTFADMIILKNYISGNIELSETDIAEHYDVNGDGVVDTGDVFLLRKRILGLE